MKNSPANIPPIIDAASLLKEFGLAGQDIPQAIPDADPQAMQNQDTDAQAQAGSRQGILDGSNAAPCPFGKPV